MLFACEKVEENLFEFNQVEKGKEFSVTEDEAITVVNLFFSGNTKGEDCQIKSIEPVVYGNETLLYIINLENDSWIIISGDKRVEPILAVDESGKEELHLKTMNNGVFTWLDDMAGSIYDLKQNRSSSMTEEYHEFWFAIQPQKILPPDGLPSDGGYFSKVS